MGKVIGYINKESGRQNIYGYVLDKDSEESLTAILMIDDDAYEVPCNIYKESLEIKFGHGRHGFKFLIPTKYKDGHEHFVKLLSLEKQKLICESILFIKNDGPNTEFVSKQKDVVKMEEISDLGMPVIRNVCNIKNKNNAEIYVSVVIAAYNCSAFIEQCIDSLINQTFKNFEIICVDDGSTDNTLEILRNYEKKYNYIHVYTQKNQYAGVARNKGMSYAKGDYLLFLDADDFFHPEMLETIYEQAVRVNAEIVVFKGQEYDMLKGTYNSCKFPVSHELFPQKEVCTAEDFGEKLFQANSCLAWNKLISHDFIKKIDVKFGSTKSSNDTIFVYTLLANAKRITFVDKVLVNYRINNPNSLQRSKANSWDSLCLAFFYLKKELISRGLYEKQKKTFINKILQAIMYYLNTIDEQTRQIFECSLRNKYFSLLDLNNITKDYIYNKAIYNQYLEIMHKEYIPVVYATDENYAKYMAVSMESIILNNIKNRKIVFFVLVNSSFSENLRMKFTRMISDSGHAIRFYSVSDDFNSINCSIEHITSPTYYRLDIPKVLSFLDKIIYLDCDTIVNSDIYDLFSIDLKDNYVAGCKAYSFNNKKHSERLCVDTSKYINSGVLLINNRLLIKDKKRNDFYQLLKKGYACQDQDILNVACIGKVLNIPLKYNLMNKYCDRFDQLIKERHIPLGEFVDAVTRPVIVHYADKIKPWDDRNVPFGFYFYYYANKLSYYF